MQGNFSFVDSLMTFHQFEAERRGLFREGQLKEKEACGFFLSFIDNYLFAASLSCPHCICIVFF